MTTGHTDDGDQPDREHRPDGDQLVGEYLQELEQEAGRLPWNARQELLEDVRSHIEVAIAESDDAELEGDRAGRIRQILAALGEPGEIVDAAASDEPSSAPPPPPQPEYAQPFKPYGPEYQYPMDPGPPYGLGFHEIAAITLLLIGGFLLGIGWIIGVVLLWTSSRWRLRDRLIGTFLVPGGLVGVLYFLARSSGGSTGCVTTSTDNVEHCTTTGGTIPSWLGIPSLIVILLAPIVTAFYLARQARARPPAHFAGRRSVAGGVVATVVGAFILLFVAGTAFALLTSGSSKSGSSGGTGTPVSSPAAPEQSSPFPVYSPSVVTVSTSP